jgi:hypothetical protein
LIAVERNQNIEVHARAVEDGAIEPFVGAIDPHTRLTVLLYTRPNARPCARDTWRCLESK